MARNNVIRMNTLHLNSVRLNGIGEVQSVSLSAGADPEQPPVTPPTYTLSASVTNGMVSATLNGSAVTLPFTANEGDTIVVEVTPNDGYTFEGWTDGNTDNPRTITMTADVVLSAQCMEVVVPSKYIQFEDPAVEAICVANWSSDGIGLTMEDAAAVTKFPNVFSQNATIETFNELQYFTGLSKLEYRAFYSCTNLREVTLPSNLSEVGQGAFQGCTSLIKVVMPQSCRTISKEAFNGCTSLSVIDLSHATSFGAYAFAGSALRSIHIEHAESFGQYVFTSMKSLTEVYIGGSVAIIPDGSNSDGLFGKCSALRKVTITAPIETIGKHAFGSCSALEEVNLDWDKVGAINARAFANCGAFAMELDIPNVTSIGEYAFYDSGLRSIRLPMIQGAIPSSAFRLCSDLAFADLGGGLSELSGEVFSSDISLTTLIVRATTPPTLAGSNFYQCPFTDGIYVPDASLEAYKTATNWNQYSARIKPLSEYA